MSLWSDCVMEREGNSVIEESWGFVEYRITLPVLRIELFYVSPEVRHPAKTRELLNRVIQIAREAGATHLWSQVQTWTLNATDSLRACLAYGFQVQAAENGAIILIKEVQ